MYAERSPRLNGSVLPEPDADLCQALAADLAEAGFAAEAVREAWGPIADDATGRGLHLPALRALTGRVDPLAVLARLLVLGMPQPTASVDAALPRTGSAGLVRLGLADSDGREVTPTSLIRPQSFADAGGSGTWWIASDLDEAALGGPLPEDHVLGVGGASMTLAGLQSSTRAHRVLDLGAGCGIQSLRARRSADEVVATDVSRRALRYTRLNALLNGVDGITERVGDLFEPVAGETFDRIVSNPPFVITPRTGGVPAYEYRDGGRIGDGLVAEVVTGIGAHLVPGGTAQLLGNWEYLDGVDGLDRVRSWIEDADIPLDAWIIEREQLDAVAYAELWIRDSGTMPGTPDHERLLARWLEDFDQRGVTAVGFGYLVLRRPLAGDPTLRRFERIAQPISDAGLGADIDRALATHDALEALSDDDLAGMTAVVAPDVTEVRHHLPGAEDPSVIELRQGGSFSRLIRVDPALAALVGACDGDLAIGAIIDAIAELMGVDQAALRAEQLPRVRELAFMGILAPAESVVR